MEKRKNTGGHSTPSVIIYKIFIKVTPHVCIAHISQGITDILE